MLLTLRLLVLADIPASLDVFACGLYVLERSVVFGGRMVLGLFEPITAVFLALTSPLVVDEVLGLVPFLSMAY